MGWVVSITPWQRFSAGKGPPVPTGQEAGWAPERVWTQSLEEKSSCICWGSNFDRPVVQSIILTELPGSHFINYNKDIFLINSVAHEPEGSSPHSQQPATGLYLEPVESNLHPEPICLRCSLIPSSHLRLGLPSGLCPSGFPTKTLYTFSSLPRVPHVPPTS
jgi:hypothetical protein